jgi:hypothetical protein
VAFLLNKFMAVMIIEALVPIFLLYFLASSLARGALSIIST